jgi:hypothetical protein
VPYIDPTLKPRTSLEEKIIQRARDAGLTLRRLRPGSRAVVLCGPAVHLTVPDLEDLQKTDFLPPSSRRK